MHEPKKPDPLTAILHILANAQNVRGQPKTMAQVTVGTRRAFQETSMAGSCG